MKKNAIRFLQLFLFSSLVLLTTQTHASIFHRPLSQQPEVAQFINRMVEKHHFDKKTLVTIFDQAKISAPVISNIKAPFEIAPWVYYKNYFITPERIQLGAEFWKQHKEALNRAYKEFGVPPEIIIAILGVETKYGTHQGEHRVIDALTTLAFTHLPRSDYFRSELEQFLLLCRDSNLNPLSIKGSYAGAIGQSQFMPSSYRTYAVDYSGDGKKDLRLNTDNAIGSIGNYLHKHGWLMGETVAVQAKVTGDNYKQFIEKSSKPTHCVSNFIKNGIIPITKIEPSTLVSLINLESKKVSEFWVGLHNFYVITQYNSSKLYAMAVFNLSHEIKNKYKQLYSKSKSL